MYCKQAMTSAFQPYLIFLQKQLLTSEHSKAELRAVSLWARNAILCRRAALCKHGYALSRVSEKPLVKGKRYSAIAGLHIGGILYIRVTTESVDADIFCEYVEQCLYHPTCCHLTSYSVVIPDNAATHHVERVTNLIEETTWSNGYVSPCTPLT